MRTVKLGEVADLSWGDTSVTKAKYVPEGQGYTAYSAAGPDGYLPYFDYERDAVVLSAIGANAGTTWLAQGKWSCIKNTIRMFSVEESILDTRFLYWVTRKSGFWPLRGSAQPFISQGDARLIEISLPQIETQQAISDVLGSLEEKIRSNRQISRLISELISAKIKNSLNEESEEMPVSALAKFVNGGAYTKDATGKGRMVLRIAELNKGPGPSTIYNEIEVPEDRVVTAGDILLSWSGSIGVYRWFREEAIVNQHIFKVLPSGLPAWFVFDRLEASLPELKSHAADKVTTMGHIQRGHLDTTKVKSLTPQQITTLDRELNPLWERLLLSEKEAFNLEKFRDAILPQLISERIKITGIFEESY